MAINKETLNKRLHDALSRYDPEPIKIKKDGKFDVIPLEDEADAFKFNFTKDGTDYGTVYASIDDKNNLTLWFNDTVWYSPDQRDTGLDYDDTFSGFLQFMKRTAMDNQLSFKTDNLDRFGNEMSRRNRMQEKEKIGESYHAVGKKARDRKSTRLNSSHIPLSRMPSSA